MIQHDLEVIRTILSYLHLQINLEKSKFLLFRNKRKIDSIQIGSDNINRVQEIRYLGLLIDDRLNWSNHIDYYIKNRIAPIIYATFKLRKIISKPALLQFYHAHLVSHITYLIPIWQSAPEFKLHQLQVIQNRVLKAINFFPRLTPTSSLYHHLPNIHTIAKIQLVILIFKIKYNLIKNNTTLRQHFDIHSRSTRNQALIYTSPVSSARYHNSALKRGIRIFNSLPLQVREENSLLKFKNRVKKFFICDIIDTF